MTIQTVLTFCEKSHEIAKLFCDINKVLTSQNDTFVQMLVILMKTAKKVNISRMIIHSYCPQLWLQTLLFNGQEYTNCLSEVMEKRHDKTSGFLQLENTSSNILVCWTLIALRNTFHYFPCYFTRAFNLFPSNSMAVLFCSLICMVIVTFFSVRPVSNAFCSLLGRVSVEMEIPFIYVTFVVAKSFKM
jgi:hypothetical protein